MVEYFSLGEMLKNSEFVDAMKDGGTVGGREVEVTITAGRLYKAEAKAKRTDRAETEIETEKTRSNNAIKKLLEANKVSEGTNPEAAKYNDEVLKKIVDEVQKEKQATTELNDETKQLADWLLYCREQSETQLEKQAQEIEALKDELEKCKAAVKTDSLETEQEHIKEHPDDL